MNGVLEMQLFWNNSRSADRDIFQVMINITPGSSEMELLRDMWAISESSFNASFQCGVDTRQLVC